MLRGVYYLMLAMALATGSGRSLWASGHGPMFGMATPTNVKDGWSLDTRLMGQMGSNATAVMSRAMLGYGITEDLQLSVSVPYVFSSSAMAPARGVNSLNRCDWEQ